MVQTTQLSTRTATSSGTADFHRVLLLLGRLAEHGAEVLQAAVFWWILVTCSLARLGLREDVLQVLVEVW